MGLEEGWWVRAVLLWPMDQERVIWASRRGLMARTVLLWARKGLYEVRRGLMARIGVI